MLSIKGGRKRREYWQHAAKLLIDASNGGSIARVTNQLMMALMFDGTLDVTATVFPPRQTVV